MVKLEVRCPICSKRGNIEVSEEEVKNSTRGLFAVNIPEDIICLHSFIAYVDKNLTIRDTYTADFQIELPVFESKEGEGMDTSITEVIDVSLIKLNLTGSNLAYIFRAMIYKNKIAVISDQDFLFDKFTQFFDYITQDSYKLNIQFISQSNFKAENFNDFVVLKGSEVLNDPEKLFNKKKLDVEKTIAQRFITEYEPTSSLIILKNELKKTYELSNSIIEIIQKLKKGKKVYSRQIIEDLEKSHNVKISMPYLDFLYEIVENYFNIEIPKSSNISNFLGTL
ncbi:MAG: hypothetical protein EU552_00275 [Promethearchaeota archaeon]|nr:MAG: hypothetical protein EU552_00275 [Candidatus Lokiarchaeota archaeon]